MCSNCGLGAGVGHGGVSSNGRALDSHSRGNGIDTRILQLLPFSFSRILLFCFVCLVRRKKASVMLHVFVYAHADTCVLVAYRAADKGKLIKG